MIPNTWQAAMQVIERIEQAGFEAVVVGGAVRDLYLNKPGNDVDVATSALPTEIKALFTSTIDVGIEHGTVLVLDTGEPIEVTTYRTEGKYEDHRRPDEVEFVRNLADDLQRRDFTINAMAFTRSGEFIDLYGGRADLDAKIIRAVGDAEIRFQEDALRMLRAVRFCAQLGFVIEQNTLAAMTKQAVTIKFVAMERVQVELSKLWTGTHVANGVAALVESGLAEFLPGQFQTVAWKEFQTTERLVGWAYFCLLNNDDDALLLSTYKCSNKDKQFVKKVLQAYRALEIGWSTYDYFQFDWDILKTAYTFAVWQQQMPPFTVEHIDACKQALAIQDVSQLAVTGRHFMEWSASKRGPWIKEALQQALLAVLAREIPNTEQHLKDWFMHAYSDEG